MANEQNVVYETLVAAEDLSSSMYKVVKMNSSGNAALATSSIDIPYGIVQDKGLMTSGQPVSVAVSGLSKVHLGATLSPDDIVATTAAGLAQVAVATQYPLGQVQKGGDSGEIGTVKLNISLVAKA